MYKTAAIGDKDSIYGFASLGVNIFPAEDAAEGIKILRRLADADYGVIYITERLAAGMTAELERFASRPLPAIIPIPGVRGNTGLGLDNVSKFVEKAVGSDILS
ncbi:MAG: V-type ATP synthase subunit F [Clostridia bacterium]|nr:V-type ATP synthase subunit F [Clostridia bacterium]